MKLMRSISGIRGVVGNTLTPFIIVSHVKAFLEFVNAKKIVIGRDSRPTGEAITDLVCGVCQLAGVDVVELGLATTPTVELLVEQCKADGGIIITASHNPVEWNALKFLNAKGMFPSQKDVDVIFENADAALDTNADAAATAKETATSKWASHSAMGKKEAFSNGDKSHIDSTLALPFVDVSAIKSKKFKVAIDAVNGAGSFILPELLKNLNCEIVQVHCEPSRVISGGNTQSGFPRGAEPTPENLSDLEKAVKENKCDIGFALDPDADRCAIVDEKGNAIGEEYTLAIAVETVLERLQSQNFSQNEKTSISINLSTSQMNEDIAEKFGLKCHRAKVGEINVSLDMIEHNGIIGGEGNGGVILPALHYGRDSLVAAALVLDNLARNNSTVFNWVKCHPAYAMLKKKFALKGNVEEVLQKTEKIFADWTIDKRDGLWLGKEKSFVHIRASNTEPVIRIIAESPSAQETEELCKKIEVLL